MSIRNTTIIKQPTTIYEPSAQKSTKKTQSSDTQTTNSFKDSLSESVVKEFKRRHPDSARHVDQQVRAGKAVREKYGNGISTEDMTMEEYQAYFYALLDTIPYDSTRINDMTIISISDKGWEQMRKDPDYEAWILGYFVEDRAVRNPFFGWGNDAGCMITEHFGASIEEHNGQGISKAAFESRKPDDDDNEDDEEDWWIKRHKRMKKLMKEQVERSMKKSAAEKAAVKEIYARQQYLSNARQHSFLTTGSPDTPSAVPNPEGIAAAMAAGAYINTLDLFGSGIPGNVN